MDLEEYLVAVLRANKPWFHRLCSHLNDLDQKIVRYLAARPKPQDLVHTTWLRQPSPGTTARTRDHGAK